MNKAIVVYVENSINSHVEFSWLYKTWKLWSLDNEYDLVVYYHPDKINLLIDYKDIKLIEISSHRMSSVYDKLNSFYCFSEEYSKYLLKYQYIFKCDYSSFLTENLKNFTPSKFTLGEGRWIDDSNKIDFIKSMASDLGFKITGINCVGESFYGKTSDVIAVCRGISSLVENILSKYSNSKEYTDNGFNVLDSIYLATQIFISYAFSNQHVNLNVLDSKSWQSTKIGTNVLQIVPDISNMSWSKKLFFEDVYKSQNISLRYSFTNAAYYCDWISKLSLSDVEFYRSEYLKNNLEIDYGLIDVNSGLTSNDKFSFIIPTMWASDTFLELLIRINNSKLVDEIILIDNQPNKKPDFKLDKVKLVTKGENIYVNPAWNWGVELAKNNLLAICNDDILFDVDKTLEFVLKNNDKLGCFGVHRDSYVSDDVDKLYENLYIPASGWGCLIFCKKENWIDIPNSLKIGYGDDWILKTNKPHWSYRNGGKITTKMSTTSKRSEFNKNITNDIKIWKKIFN